MKQGDALSPHLFILLHESAIRSSKIKTEFLTMKGKLFLVYSDDININRNTVKTKKEIFDNIEKYNQWNGSGDYWILKILKFSFSISISLIHDAHLPSWKLCSESHFIKPDENVVNGIDVCTIEATILYRYGMSFHASFNQYPNYLCCIKHSYASYNV